MQDYLIDLPDAPVFLPPVQVVLHVGQGVLDVEVYCLYGVNRLWVGRDIGEECELVHLIFAFNFLRKSFYTGAVHPAYKQLGPKM